MADIYGHDYTEGPPGETEDERRDRETLEDLEHMLQFVPIRGVDDRDLPPRRKQPKGIKYECRAVVYFIQCNGSKGPIKIGWSNWAPTRLKEIAVCNPYPVKVLATIPSRPSLETVMHKRFDEYHIRGEWFSAGQKLMEFIQEVAKECPRRSEDE